MSGAAVIAAAAVLIASQADPPAADQPNRCCWCHQGFFDTVESDFSRICRECLSVKWNTIHAQQRRHRSNHHAQSGLRRLCFVPGHDLKKQFCNAMQQALEAIPDAHHKIIRQNQRRRQDSESGSDDSGMLALIASF